MCGRFTLHDTDDVKEKFNIEIKPSYNITPSQDVLVYDGKLHYMKWAYNPYWSKKKLNLINCRIETMNQKPSFKKAERCVFLLNGWYEWKRENNEKQPYYFTNYKLFFMGGLKNNNGCCIVTKQAKGELSLIHHRQPVILKFHEINNWLKGSHSFQTKIDNEIKILKVSKKVNNTANNTKDNIVKKK